MYQVQPAKCNKLSCISKYLNEIEFRLYRNEGGQKPMLLMPILHGSISQLTHDKVDIYIVNLLYIIQRTMYMSSISPVYRSVPKKLQPRGFRIYTSRQYPLLYMHQVKPVKCNKLSCIYKYLNEIEFRLYRNEGEQKPMLQMPLLHGSISQLTHNTVDYL